MKCKDGLYRQRQRTMKRLRCLECSWVKPTILGTAAPIPQTFARGCGTVQILNAGQDRVCGTSVCGIPLECGKGDTQSSDDNPKPDCVWVLTAPLRFWWHHHYLYSRTALQPDDITRCVQTVQTECTLVLISTLASFIIISNLMNVMRPGLNWRILKLPINTVLLWQDHAGFTCIIAKPAPRCCC